MSAYVFHPEAYTDLSEIWEFIAEDNVDAADRVLGEITKQSAPSYPFPIKATCVLI